MITYGGQLIAKNGTLNIPANIAVINATINSRTTSYKYYGYYSRGYQLDFRGGAPNMHIKYCIRYSINHCECSIREEACPVIY